MKRLLLVLAAFAALAAAAPGLAQAAVPTGAVGVGMDGRVELSWDTSPGASAYSVYRGLTPTSITTRLTPTGGTVAPGFADTTAVNGTTYYYAVRSIDPLGGESANSLVVQAAPAARSCSTGNAVVLENCFPGNSGWNTRAVAAVSAGGIEGFATATSINRGESVNLKVNSGAGSTFRVEIYRSGYYGGTGGRLFSVIRGVPGVAQPACTTDNTIGLIDCSNWSVSASIRTMSAWPSGVYLLRLVREDTGADNHILLVVRDDGQYINPDY